MSELADLKANLRGGLPVFLPGNPDAFIRKHLKANLNVVFT